MLKSVDKKLSVYKGDYRPVEIYKNNEKIHGFKTMGMSGVETIFKNTYNAPMTIYGKSGYVQAKNLCPPPNSIDGFYDDNTEIYNWRIIAKENGYFDVSGAMIAGNQVTKALLGAGTYTVSGCEYIQLWWEERDGFLTIPATFTLEKETEVLCVMWYTSTENISLEDQYIQIEKSSKATAYSEYVGNPDFPPSPDNKMQLVSASGTITCDSPGGIKNSGSYSFETPELAGIAVEQGHYYNYSEKSGSTNYYYVSDVLSGTSIKRNIGQLLLSGEEEFSQKDIQSTTHNCYYCDISHLIKKKRTADACICNCFEIKNELNVDENGIVLGQNDTNLYFVVEKKSFSTLEKFVQWISKQYNSTPVSVHYILDNELTEASNQPSLISFPIQTHIKMKYKSMYPKLALSKCIMIQNS